MTEKKEQTLWKSDPKRYAKCSEPFADTDTANAALEAFFDAVGRAREEHLIADVEVIVKDSTGEGEATGAFMSSAHFGSQLERESMLAYAFGQAQKDRQRLISLLLAGERTTPRK